MMHIWHCALCAFFLFPACQTHHLITLRSDRSVVIRNTSLLDNAVRHYYGKPAVIMVDTSVVGNSIVVISDIDSLGRYLPTFDPRQVTVSLHDNELSVHFNTAPVLKGWAGTGLTFFVENSIEKTLSAKRKLVLDSGGLMKYASIRIPRKVLRKQPSELDFTLRLRGFGSKAR